MPCIPPSLLFFLFFFFFAHPCSVATNNNRKGKRKTGGRGCQAFFREMQRERKRKYTRNRIYIYVYRICFTILINNLIRDWNWNLPIRRVFSFFSDARRGLYPRARIVVTNINEIRVGCIKDRVKKKKKERKKNEPSSLYYP